MTIEALDAKLKAFASKTTGPSFGGLTLSERMRENEAHFAKLAEQKKAVDALTLDKAFTKLRDTIAFDIACAKRMDRHAVPAEIFAYLRDLQNGTTTNEVAWERFSTWAGIQGLKVEINEDWTSRGMLMDITLNISPA